MTPKEKADEIYTVIQNIIPGAFVHNESKECALYLCDIVIKYSKQFEENRNINGDEYWLEVKKEIEKL